MRRARAAITIPGTRIADAEALWYDLGRWPSFVEGFKHVERVDAAWPQEGAVLVWRSVPDGRGRVAERVTRYVQREGQHADVGDPKIRGRQSVTFAVAGRGDREADAGVQIALELEYELRDSGPFAALTDLLFIRRAQADALRRTLVRFARELESDRRG
jgi:hypothetical protein